MRHLEFEYRIGFTGFKLKIASPVGRDALNARVETSTFAEDLHDLANEFFIRMLHALVGKAMDELVQRLKDEIRIAGFKPMDKVPRNLRAHEVLRPVGC